MIPDRDRPTAVTFSATHMQVALANGRTLFAPLTDYPLLAHATTSQRAHVRLGLAVLHWPDLDLTVTLWALLGGNPTPQGSRNRFCEG